MKRTVENVVAAIQKGKLIIANDGESRELEDEQKGEYHFHTTLLEGSLQDSINADTSYNRKMAIDISDKKG
jgi:hypothetical protein